MLIRKRCSGLLPSSTGRPLTKTALANSANACRCSASSRTPALARLMLVLYCQTAQPELFVVYEPTTEQTFVVNRRFLRERLSDTVFFVEVGGKVPALVGHSGALMLVHQRLTQLSARTQLETAPSSVQKLLDAIANHAATSSDSSFFLLHLDPPGRTSDLIPLAGILLDYAAAYCVSSEDGSNCLSGRELHLIEAFSITAGSQRFERAIPLPLMISYQSHPTTLTPSPSFAFPGTTSSRSHTPPRLSRAPRPRWNRKRSSPKSIANSRDGSAQPSNGIQNWRGSLWRLNTIQSRWIRLHCNRSVVATAEYGQQEVRKASRERKLQTKRALP